MAGGDSPWKLDPSGPAFRMLVESLDTVAAAEAREQIVQLAFLASETDPDACRSLRDFVEGPLRRAIQSVLDAGAADTVAAALEPLMERASTSSVPAARSSAPAARSGRGFRKPVSRDEPGSAVESKSPFLVQRSVAPPGQSSSRPAPKPFREEIVDAEPRRLGRQEQLAPSAAAVPADEAEQPRSSAAPPPAPARDVSAELRESLRREMLPGIREEALTMPSRPAPARAPAPPPAAPSSPPVTSVERAEVLIVTADQGVADDFIQRLAGRASARWVKDMMEMMRAPEIGSDAPPKVVLDLCSLPMDARMLASLAPVIPPRLRIVLWGASADLESSLQGTGWDDTRWTAVDGSSSADEVIYVLG